MTRKKSSHLDLVSRNITARHSQVFSSMKNIFHFKCKFINKSLFMHEYHMLFPFQQVIAMKQLISFGHLLLPLHHPAIQVQNEQSLF